MRFNGKSSSSKVSHHLRAVVVNHLQTSHGLVLPACLPAEMLGSSAVRTSVEVSEFGEGFFVAYSRVIIAVAAPVVILLVHPSLSRTVMAKLMIRAK